MAAITAKLIPIVLPPLRPCKATDAVDPTVAFGVFALVSSAKKLSVGLIVGVGIRNAVAANV